MNKKNMKTLRRLTGNGAFSLVRLTTAVALISAAAAMAFVAASPASVFANDGAFDIDELSVDQENRFSNVGAFIVAVVDDSGNVVGLRAHCSGVLIHRWRSSRPATASARGSSGFRRTSNSS